LGTEGQNSELYPERKPYGTMAFCFPLGVGVKYNIAPRVNLTFEIMHRFTTTDYLDDVSTTYAGTDVFGPLPNGDPSLPFCCRTAAMKLLWFPSVLQVASVASVPGRIIYHRSDRVYF
jgi:hypothetical protein